MSFKYLTVGMTAAGLICGSALSTVVRAQDSIFVPLLTYRTGPFAGNGIPLSNGVHDYLTMLNERDGGIGGVKIAVEECETGYKNEKGVECYEAVKGRKPAVINPYSTGITLAIIPKAGVDKIRWPTVFQPPPTARSSHGSSIRPRPIGTACR